MECLSNELCIPKKYDKNKSPTKPIKVFVRMDLVQISEVDDSHGTVDIVVNVVLRWNDDRLIVKNSTEVSSEKMGYSLAPRWQGIELNQKWMNKIWIPRARIWSMLNLIDLIDDDVGESYIIFGAL